MFNGMPITTSSSDHQFHHHNHQFIVAAANSSSTSSSVQLPTIFTTIHHGFNDDLYNINLPPVVPPALPLLPNESKSSSLILEDLWSYDEILALLKVRSTIQNNWFPDLSNTWEHVSRKLGELGFKRSPAQCKQKFEEQGPHQSLNYNNDRNNIFTELDEFYPNQHNKELEQQQGEEEEEENKNLDIERSPAQQRSEEMNEELQVVKQPNKKRKRILLEDDMFETFKGFCETIVNKMMSQQEELHNKLIQYIVKKDAENIAREEAWKNQEMERIKIESERRAQEQQIVGKRQAIIIEFLKKFTSEKDQLQQNSNKMKETSTSSNNINDDIIINNVNMISTHNKNQNTPKTPSPPRPPNSSKESKLYSQKSGGGGGGGDNNMGGMRWPRDQVFALINLRCKLSSSNEESSSSSNNKEGVKGPLWERISQGMLELGYKRSAKRCKEKWENINKYFRKTKDSNKKRSMDSRTCPYFHQLSCLYTQGTGTGTADQAPINSIETTEKEPPKD